MFIPGSSGGPAVADEDTDGGHFGWQFFTAASDEAKRAYIGALLGQALHRTMPPNYAALVVKEWAGTEVEGSIDHQSEYILPNAFGTKLPDEEFFGELRDYFLDPSLVVLGGNDNDDKHHPLGKNDFVLPIPRDSGSEDWTCRKDEAHDYWVLFNMVTGTKIRFRFTHDPKKLNIVPKKASAPELIDIKITDFCPFNCEFCYQGSTADGQHDYGVSEWSLARQLADLKVFEVAIGGGEPTMAPKFMSYLRSFREAGITPNFTTKNLAWLRDPKVCPEIIENCGAFAYSADHSSGVEELVTMLDYSGIPHRKANVQAIIGPGLIDDQYKLQNMVTACHEADVRLTLLGYKTTGRGEAFKAKQNKKQEMIHTRYARECKPGWWVGVLNKMSNEHKCGSVGIDTLLAAEAEETLKEIKVPAWLFTTKEGEFSCYIDLVKKKIGPSSYCDEKEMIQMESVDAESISAAFAKF